MSALPQVTIHYVNDTRAPGVTGVVIELPGPSFLYAVYRVADGVLVPETLGTGRLRNGLTADEAERAVTRLMRGME